MKLTTKQIVHIAVIAAVYAVLTAIFSTISFTPMQLRISEIMIFLACFNPIYIIGLTLGCFIVNILMSPYVLLDSIFGTLATFLSALMMYYTAKTFKMSKKGIILASIWPTIFNGLIVGTIIYICGIMEATTVKNVMALIGYMGSVAFGEFVVVSMIGLPVVYFLMTRYKGLVCKLMRV